MNSDPDGPTIGCSTSFVVAAATAGFLFVLFFSSDARASVAVADGVKSQLMGIAPAALGVGIVWIGYLVIMGRGSMQLIVTFLIGAAIVFAGGFLS